MSESQKQHTTKPVFKLSHWALVGFIVLIMLSCRTTILNENYQAMAPFKKISAIVHAGDSVKIVVEVDTEQTLVKSIRFQASDGIISGYGPKAIFNAPSRKESVHIVIKITTQSHHEISDTLTILIYKQFVILKADDLHAKPGGSISPEWKRFIQFIQNKNIQAGLGLIGNALEIADWSFVQYLQKISHNPHFEIWNHGYNHLLNQKDKNGATYSEFKNTSRAYQKHHLLKTQELAKQYLGIVLHTFGAPGNAFDDNTAKVLQEIPEIHVWLFGRETPGKFVLKRTIDVEHPIFHPDYDYFLQHYNPNQRYLVLQIHPAKWNEEQFNEFARVIDFLLRQDVTFVTPYAYFQLYQKEIHHHPLVVRVKNLR